jgi:hypothetical protein
VKISKTKTALAAVGGLLLAVGIAGAALTAPAPGFLRMTPEEANWNLMAGEAGRLGMQQAIIYGDPTKPGLYIVRNRFPAGVMSTPHAHSDDRIGIVLKGTWWTGTSATMDRPRTVPVRAGGTMIHPKGEMHYDGARDEEVIVQIVGFGPTVKTPAVAGSPDFAKE